MKFSNTRSGVSTLQFLSVIVVIGVSSPETTSLVF